VKLFTSFCADPGSECGVHLTWRHILPATSSVPTSSRRISESTVRRLSLYLRSLEDLESTGEETVSSQELARRVGTTAAQVRKDLSSFGSFGKRGLGYAVAPLRERVTDILGLDRAWPVVLVGAGRIGSALFAYPHFRSRGFHIVAVVDRDPDKVERNWNGIRIEPVDRLATLVQELRVELGILAVPGDVAQEVAEALVAAGVRGILNFAPAQLHLPRDIVVNDVNLTLEMEALSFALQARIRAGTDRG